MAPLNALPLVPRNDADAIIAYERGRPVSLAHFLADVLQVARSLPERHYILNLCTDRYHFLVGLGAALTRQQITLLPPDHTPELIARLARDYSALYCLSDSSRHSVRLDCVAYGGAAPGTWESTLPAVPAFADSQVAAHVFTSGSTGQPSVHEKTWGTLVRGCQAAARALGIADHPEASLLGTVPAQHMYGLESTVLLPLQHGLAMDGARPFYPADIVARLSELPRPRILVTTPVHLRALLADAATLPPLDLLVCATAPLAPQLALEAERRFHAPLREIYGCTEAGQLAQRRTVDGSAWTLFEGIRLHTDERGTWVEGGSVEGQVALQDVIEIEPAGGFHLHGRSADVINVAGKRTSLGNLNFQLNSIPGVADGAFAVPQGENEAVSRLVAFVVAPGLTEAAIQKALRARIDPAFMPRPLYRVAALPRNATGKLPKDALLRLLADASTAGR